MCADPPEVSLTLGQQIDPVALKEGSDVYLECRVRANPTIFKIEWLHNVSAGLAACRS